MTLADGRYTALDGHSLYVHKSAGGAVYRAVLRAEVRRRLPRLSWRLVGRGLFELEGVPDSVVCHFSQRRVEIEERALALVGVGAAGELSRERMQGIALATRKAKYYGVDGGTWREQAQARAAEHGLGGSELASLRDRALVDARPTDLVALTERLSGPEGLTETHNAFARRHAVAEIAGAFPQGATMSLLEDATSRYLHDHTVARLSGPDGELRYTTHELLARERALIKGPERRGSERTGLISPARVDTVLAECVPALNDDQAAAVRAITSSGRGVEAVAALAGTGKTTMLAALAGAYRQVGWRVIGTAPTAHAARELREVAGIEPGPMHSLLATLGRPGRLDASTVLVLDEAGMAPIRRSAQLFMYAELAGAKVIAIGDPGQLGSVEAGGWLAALTRRQQGPALTQVTRQQNQQEQRALQALHHGDPSHYLANKQDAITVHETEVDAVRQLNQAWHASSTNTAARGGDDRPPQSHSRTAKPGGPRDTQTGPPPLPPRLVCRWTRIRAWRPRDRPPQRPTE
jgi:AAA domain/TrwC relaxase